MQTWEYKVVHRQRPAKGVSAGDWDVSVVQQLPALGNEGWELVTVVTRSSEVGSTVSGVTTDEMWVFKRPKAEQSDGVAAVLAAEAVVERVE